MPDERLPPRQRWTKRRRLAARTPKLHRQRDATIVKPADRRLPTLPANDDREIPTPGGPTGYVMCSHHHFLRAHHIARRDAGRHEKTRATKTSASPQGSSHEHCLCRSEVAASQRISRQRDSLCCACGRLARWLPAGWRTKRLLPRSVSDEVWLPDTAP